MLYQAEALKEFAPRIQNLRRENVLLPVDPQVGETLLGRVENFSQVAEAAVFVEHLVSFRELVPVTASGASRTENFAEPLYLIEETLAGSLPLLGVEVVFLIVTLLEVIRHHNCVFEQEEVRGASEFFDLGEGSRGRC